MNLDLSFQPLSEITPFRILEEVRARKPRRVVLTRRQVDHLKRLLREALGVPPKVEAGPFASDRVPPGAIGRVCDTWIVEKFV